MYEEDKNGLGRKKGEMKGEWIKMELNALLCPRPNEHQHLLGSQLFFLPLSRLNKEKETASVR